MSYGILSEHQCVVFCSLAQFLTLSEAQTASTAVSTRFHLVLLSMDHATNENGFHSFWHSC